MEHQAGASDGKAQCRYARRHNVQPARRAGHQSGVRHRSLCQTMSRV